MSDNKQKVEDMETEFPQEDQLHPQAGSRGKADVDVEQMSSLMEQLSNSRRPAVRESSAVSPQTRPPNHHELKASESWTWDGFDWFHHSLAPPNPPQNSPVKGVNLGASTSGSVPLRSTEKKQRSRRKFMWPQKISSKKRMKLSFNEN